MPRRAHSLAPCVGAGSLVKAAVKRRQKLKLNIDHIIALAKGGSNDISNLQVLCSQCNQTKKANFDDRFQRYYD